MALKAAQALISTEAQLYLTFSITDPIDGALTFYWGEMPFSATNAYGGPPVYYCIKSFGDFVKYASEGGRARQSEVVVELDPYAFVSPSNQANLRYEIAPLFRNMDIRDTAVSIYQWNALDAAQELIWKGFWGGIKEWSSQDGESSLSVILRSNPKAADAYLADVVSRDVSTFAKAANAAVGLMCGRLYGSLKSRIDVAQAYVNDELSPLLLGYGHKAIRSLPIDESISYAEPHTRYRFGQNDGTTGWLTFALGSIPSGVGGNIWVYIPEMGVYAHLDSTSVTSWANDGTDVRADITNAPIVWVVLRPSIKGSETSAGLTNLNYMMDDDAANRVVVSDIANNIIGFECPNMALPGATVEELRIAVDVFRDVTGGGPFDIGLWNIHASGGATWWGGSTKYQTISSGAGVGQLLSGKREQFITTGTGGAGAWGVWRSTEAAPSGTQSEFNNGRFVTIDGSGNRVPIQIRIGVSGVPMYYYGVALLVKVRYPVEQIGTFLRRSLPNPFGGGEDPSSFYEDIYTPIGEKIRGPGQRIGVFQAPTGFPGIEVISDGEGQKDDVSGTYTGTASALIQKSPDVARHIIKAIGGKTTNDTAGVLGNFTDARTEGTAGELTIAAPLGPEEPSSWRTAVESIQARLPLGIYEEDGVWQCVKNEMNPHSSRIYRSASEQIKISAKRDILDGYLKVREIDVRGIVNNAVVNYGHSYGRDSSLGSFYYEHPLSKYRFGLSSKLQVDEPWITRPDLSADHPEAAKWLARFKASVSARPRLTPVIVRLTQAFYDLRPGHVLEFDSDMEDVGFVCPAYRGGRLQYQFQGSHVPLSSNQADDTTPVLLAGGRVDRQYYAGADQQFPQLDLHISVAATHTTVVNAWKYYDGAAWTSLTGISASDGGDPDTVFKRTGDITVSYTRPTITSWKKGTLTFSTDPCGPVYWVRYEAVTVISAANGNGLTAFPGKWVGRLFEVLEVKRIRSQNGLPAVEAVLQEVM